MKRFLWLLVGLVVITPFLPVSGVGLIIVDEKHWFPGPIPPEPPFPPMPPRPPWPPRPRPFCPLEITSVNVNARINDQVAVTAIDQEFYNPNSETMEGTFVFPVPKGAQLDKFTMEINGKQVSAELLKADKARNIYEEIVRKARDPALLEYAGQDAFKVRIFPIEGHSHKRVTFSYTQLLKDEDGLIAYTLPLNTEKFSAKPLKNVSVKIELESQRPLKSIYSPTHADLEVKRHGEKRATAGFEARNTQPDTDLALYFSREKDEIGLNLLTFRTADKDGFFLLLASPGLEAKKQRVLPKDVVFVLDTSGSMAGKKLDQAKKALQFCIENLNEQDRFEIVRFSTEVEPLFEKLTTATSANRDKADNFVKDLRPMGGTAIDDALKRALAMGDNLTGSRVFVVIFLTDGRPTIGNTDEAQILTNVSKHNEARTRLFCFGIGTDVNTHLLDKIAGETRAFSQYVLPEEDLEVKVSSFFSKIKEPVLANPVLKFTGDVHVSKVYPGTLPDIFKGEQLIALGRYSGQGSTAAILEGTVEGKNRQFTYDVQFDSKGEDHDFIPRLWATRRVGYLLDEIRLHGENAELKDEVVQLARDYNIVTPYTAYLIVEDESRRDVPRPLRSMQSFDADRQAREEGGRSWSELRSARSGDAAVADSLAAGAMKQAGALSAPGASAPQEQLFRRRYGVSNGGSATSGAQISDTAERVIQYSQQTRSAGGKTFFQNDKQWIDSTVQTQPDAKKLRIQFVTPDYFKLMADHPETRPWLALGQNVQFVLRGTLYEIYE